MTRWVCARDQTPVTGPRTDPWCPTCQAKTLAVEDGPLTYLQYRDLCDLFTSIGELNRARRLRWISQAVRRPIGDYRDLSAADAAAALAKLKERIHPHE